MVLKTAEKLDENGRIDQSVTGKDYAWTYILNDKKEQEFAPDFTYTGFRYVEITGAVPEKEITLDCFTGNQKQYKKLFYRLPAQGKAGLAGADTPDRTFHYV